MLRPVPCFNPHAKGLGHDPIRPTPSPTATVHKMGAEASTDDFDRPDERAVDRLDGDSLAAILSSLDARSLGMALGVSQHW